MQLKQVASAQLELITSDSFDVYSPEIEAIRNEKDNMIAEQVPEEPKAPKAPTKMEIPEPLVKEQPVMKETVEKEPEDLSETMVLPDVKKEKRAKKKNEELQEDILTADTIDLSDTLNQIQKPKDADTKEVTDALVLDPVDAVVKEPFEAVPNSAVTLESNPEMLSLEPEEDKKEKETPSLDSLLQNINLGKKNKKKKTTAIISSVIAACIFIIAAIVAVNVLSPSVTAELTSSAWVPEGAKNASGDEVEMSEVYNTNYSAYQGSMSFSDDGTFTLWLSPGSPDDGTHSGKYTVSASDKVNLSFDDGTNTSAALTQKNGKVSAVVLKYNDYEITFVKQ